MSNSSIPKITPRELTIREIRDVMRSADAEKLEIGIIDMLFPDTIPGAVVKISTGLTDETIDAMKPSELGAIVEAVKTANPLYDRHLARIRGIIKKMQESSTMLSAGRSSRSETPD